MEEKLNVWAAVVVILHHPHLNLTITLKSQGTADEKKSENNNLDTSKSREFICDEELEDSADDSLCSLPSLDYTSMFPGNVTEDTLTC